MFCDLIFYTYFHDLLAFLHLFQENVPPFCLSFTSLFETILLTIIRVLFLNLVVCRIYCFVNFVKIIF